jgi:cell division transport system permease protein
MFWTNTKRVIRSGFVNFWRNGVVSVASVLIMTVTLFVIGLMIFVGALLESSLVQIKDKVDINIYLSLDATDDSIINLKNSIESLPEVLSVQYTTRDQALENFKARHENDYLTIQALDELNENPLGASLSVKAKKTSQYEGIAKFLEDSRSSDGSKSIINKINYFQNKIAIDRLTKIIAGVEKISFAVAIFMIVVSIIIMFNTIRLAIYTAREEIAVMRLVGASNLYIRGPFVVEGVIYGVFSSIVAMVLFYPITFWLGDATVNFFGGINLFEYYIQNFAQIFLTILISGVLLGSISSYLAVRKYLKV